MRNLLALLLTIFVLTILLSGNVNATNVNSCQNITASGTYDLTQGLINDLDRLICIDIQTPNVTLNCNGYSMSSQGGIVANQIGINVNVSNVTIKNCYIQDYTEAYGIKVSGTGVTNNFTLYNTTVEDALYSLYLDTTNGTNVTNVTISYTSIAAGSGIRLFHVQNSTFTSINSQIAGTDSYENYAITGTENRDNLNFTNITTTFIASTNTYVFKIAATNVTLNGITIDLTNCSGCFGVAGSNIGISSSLELKNAQIYATGESSKAFTPSNMYSTVFNATLAGATNAIEPYTSVVNFYDIIISNGGIKNQFQSNLTFTNTSASSTLIREISDHSTNTYFVQPVNISVRSSSTVNVSNYSLQTNYSASSGFALFNVTTLKYNSSGTFNYTNVTIKANSTNWYSSTNLILQAPYNGGYQTASLQIGLISHCQNITLSGNYQLTQNASKDNTGHPVCIDIQTPAVTLDCNGYSISPTQTTPTNQIGVKTNVSNVTIQNCNLYNYNTSTLGAISAIGATYINNITISNTSITNSLYALEYEKINNSNVSNFNFTTTLNTNFGIGISITDVQNSTFSNITSHAQSAIAISYFNFYLAGSTKNINFTDVQSNVSISSSALFRGSDFLGVNFNQIYGNLTGCSTCEGFSDFGDSTFTVKNTRINATSSSAGVAVSIGSNATGNFSNFTASGTSNAIYLYGASTINFSDTTITNGNITNRQAANLTFTNTSISTSNITAITDTSTNTYFVQPINITVQPIDATVNVSNYSLQTNWLTTNQQAQFNVTVLKYNTSGTYNYTILVLNANTSNNLFRSTSEIIQTPYQGAYQEISLQLAIPRCASITNSGTYALTQNISANVDKCLNVTAQHVTINCNGYWINSNSTSAQYAIYSDAINTTINSCAFSNYIRNSTSHAIYGNNHNLTVYNSTFYNLTGGIRSEGAFNYYNISTNTFKLLNDTAIYLSSGRYSNISNNNITNVSNVILGAITLASSNTNSTINNNTIRNVTVGGNGIRADGSYQVVYNNTIINANSGVYATSCDDCGSFQNVSYNNIYAGVGIQLGPNSVAQSNTLNATVFINNKENNSVFDNTFANIGAAQNAIYFDNVNNTNVFRNTITNFTSTAKALYNSGVNSTNYYDNNFTNASNSFEIYNSNITVVNSSFNLTAITIDASSTLNYKTPVRISTITAASAELASVTLTIKNSSTTLASGTSNATGYLDVNTTTLLYNFSATPLNYSSAAVITGTKVGYTQNTNTINLIPGLSNYQTATLTLTATAGAGSSGGAGGGGGGGGGSGGATTTNVVATNSTQETNQLTNPPATHTSNPKSTTTVNTQENETQANETQETKQNTNAGELPLIPISVALVIVGGAVAWFTLIKKPHIQMPKPN